MVFPSVATEPTPVSELDHRLRDHAPGWHFAGRYRMECLIGRGAMGVVWRAQDETLDRPVALKFLVETLVHDPMAIDDLKRETRRALELTHHNIVRVYDFVENQAQGLAGIAMEFFPGKTIAATRIAQPTRCFSPDIIAPWIAQLCDAMAYAHEKVGVIHRDLKPQNLMIDDRGELKITDFGIARVASDSLTRISIGKVSGTPCYMSPQQARGEPPKATDDIYAIGATLYELLTSRPPFWQGNIGIQLAEFIAPPMAERRLELTGIEGELPADWEETIAACLAKNALERPQSARELADRLGISLPSTRFHLGSSTRSAIVPPSPAPAVPSPDGELDMPTLVGVPLIPPPPPTTPPSQAPASASPPPLPSPSTPFVATAGAGRETSPPDTDAQRMTTTPRRPIPTWAWVAGLGSLLAIAAFVGGALVRNLVSGSGPASKSIVDMLPVPRTARTIQVPGDFATIQAAIDDSRPGDSIVIRGGTYRESVILRDGIRLSGESAGGSQIAPPPGAAAVVLARGVRGCVIQNLSIEMSGAGDGTAWSAGWSLKNDPAGVLVGAVLPNSPAEKAGIVPGVRLRALDGQTIESAEEVPYLLARGASAREVQADLESNGARKSVKFTTERIAGVGNWPDGLVISNSEVNVTGCTVRGAGGVGIVLLGELTTGELSGNLVVDGLMNGISLVHTKGSVTLRNNQVRENKSAGITFDHADGVAIDNTIEHNGSVGIRVSSAESSPSLQGNHCRDHANSGIYFAEGAAGVAEGNHCERNADSGIFVTGGSTAPTLRANRCIGNLKNGIAFSQGARGLAEKNVVEKNAFPGIAVLGPTTAPTLRANECRKNTQSGIFFTEAADGIAEENICEENGDAGIAVTGRDTAPRLVGNQCHRNRDNGMSFGDQSSARAEKNTCTGNGACGIGAAGRATLTLQGNICRGNTVHGIAFAGASRGTVTGNTCEENTDSGLAAFGEGTAPDFIKNTTRRNAHYGVYFGTGADGEATGNLCEENRLSGIRVTNLSTRPTISANRLMRNQKYGIEVTEGASPRIGTDNEFGGNAAGTVSK